MEKLFGVQLKKGVAKMKYLKERLKEPSSWAGLSMFATVFLGVPTNTAELVVKAAQAIAAAVAVLVPEKKAA
jgi:hypothetical protein